MNVFPLICKSQRVTKRTVLAVREVGLQKEEKLSFKKGPQVNQISEYLRRLWTFILFKTFSVSDGWKEVLLRKVLFYRNFRKQNAHIKQGAGYLLKTVMGGSVCLAQPDSGRCDVVSEGAGTSQV